MTSLRRIWVAASCLLGLAACNNVVSIDPWFTAADAQGVPKFRDGLWLSVDGDCRVNVARPAERWPDCARASYVRGDERFEMAWDESDGDGGRRRTFAGWQEDPTLVVMGDPLIGQVEVQPDPPTSPPDEVVDDAEAGELPWRYLYYAIRPARFDEQGDVIAFESWGVSCGPSNEPERPASVRRRGSDDDELADDANYVTDRPFPGLTIHGNNCTAESADALRRAATLSEPLATHGTSRWVRDGWR